MNRNTLQQLLHFSCVFNNPTIYIIECNSWTVKCLQVNIYGFIAKSLKSLGGDNMGGKVSDSIGEQLELGNMGWIKISHFQYRTLI